jgi:hypothetical protein
MQSLTAPKRQRIRNESCKEQKHRPILHPSSGSADEGQITSSKKRQCHCSAIQTVALQHKKREIKPTIRRAVRDGFKRAGLSPAQLT